MSEYDDYCELFKLQDGNRLAFHPEANIYLPVNDAREKSKIVSDQHPLSYEAKKAFYQQRLKRVEASKLPGERKNQLLTRLQNSLKEAESKADVGVPPSAPKPEGRGFGVFYRENELTYETSSTLFYRIVAVPDVGTDLSEWLYLTSTNHSPRGTEAYISYEKRLNPTFSVFDWSKLEGEQWVVCKPYSELSNYLMTFTVSNHEYPTIYVMNNTRKKPGTASTWINEVMLLNKVTNAYDFVYSSEYPLPASEVGNGLDWGPIVESVPPGLTETNRIGFFNATLLLDGTAFKLTQDVTDRNLEESGFDLVLLEPNFSFIVQ